MNKSDLTKAQRWELADYLAQTRLEEINKHCKDVKPASNIYSKYIKRFIDIIVSALLLIITSPINLIIFIVTAFTLGNPIFFR